MPQGFLIGDVHLGLHQLELDKWLDIHKDYFYKFLIPILKERYTIGDKLFILGDLFDNRNHLNLKVISFVLDLFNELELLGIDVLIIGGNHDYYNLWDAEYTSLRILEKYKNIEIVNDVNVYTFSDKKILLLPWNKHSAQLKEMKKYAGKVDYLFTHSDLRGAKTGMRNTLTVGNTIADYIGFPRVYASHIHIYQEIENFKFLGSPFHMDRNDKGNKKGLTILDFTAGSEEFVENTISPKFTTLEIKTEEDIKMLDDILENNVSSLHKKDDFIDVVINNSVLLSSKEAKKKIEEISKSGKVLKIKQYDDTTIDDGIENISLDDIGVTMSTEDLIREYIKNQQTDDTLKSRFMEILEETIKISKTNGAEDE